MREVILPTIQGMKKEGIPFTGFLYAGLMIAEDGSVKTLEFNARLGDPETQPLMMRLKSDLFELLWAATAPGGGQLNAVELDWDRRVALGVVVASEAYPAQPVVGDAIQFPAQCHPDVKVFHAGTRLEGDQCVTSGGRVLCVTALGEGVRSAQHLAYDALKGIQFRGMQFRRDIGHRAISSH
jgi:phosphoribosylamine--glycine ligase